MKSKTEQVKTLFEIPEKYLNPRQFDIRIRVETVQEFSHARRFNRVLDIGCGNAAISLPLLERSHQLMLLDISKNMLELARKRIPTDRLDDVELVEGNFLKVKLEPESFDLILCIGVLAHVDSPASAINRLVELAKPGSWIVLEFTDSFHFWGWPIVLYQKLLKLLRPEPYALNRLKRRQIIDICKKHGLKTSGIYRYGLPPLGSSWFMGQDKMYQMVRYLFGPSGKNRNRWMGNQFIYCLQKD
jgi:ubiquinone/menaquinone biosynthesis C-methylase UbiE